MLGKFKTRTKTKPNKTPHKQKNIAKNHKQNETNWENYTQKTTFYYLIIEKWQTLIL